MKPVKVNTIVAKKSGKPFKSGSKTAKVKQIVHRLVPSGRQADGSRTTEERIAYKFFDEQEDYVVDAQQCQEINQ